MPAKPTDDLLAAIEHLRSWASTQRIAWIPGQVSEERGDFPRVHFSVENVMQQPLASAQEFTRTLGELDVAMLVVSITTLDEETQLSAVSLYEEPEVMDNVLSREARDVVKAMLADARAASRHIGEPGSVQVTALTRNPTIAIDWSETADWYMVIEAAEMAYADMEEAALDFDEDDDNGDWEQIEADAEPEPPEPPRRRISPRR